MQAPLPCFAAHPFRMMPLLLFDVPAYSRASLSGAHREPDATPTSAAQLPASLVVLHGADNCGAQSRLTGLLQATLFSCIAVEGPSAV